jgi:hypothetical protein
MRTVPVSAATQSSEADRIAELEGRVGDLEAQVQIDKKEQQAQLTLLMVQVAALINNRDKKPVMVDTQTSPIEPPPAENSRASTSGGLKNLADMNVEFGL